MKVAASATRGANSALAGGGRSAAENFGAPAPGRRRRRIRAGKGQRAARQSPFRTASMSSLSSNLAVPRLQWPREAPQNDLYSSSMQGADKTQPARIASLLETKGISATRQRREIARLLLGRPRHITAEQLMELLQQGGHAISKATVYNTLKLFVSRGLLREIHVDATRTVFDTTTTPHHHFYNVDTGELHDIATESVEFARLPPAPEGTVGDGVDVIMRVRNGPQLRR